MERNSSFLKLKKAFIMKKAFKYLLYFFCISLFIGVISICLIFAYYSINLPKYTNLEDYQPPITSRVYSSDGVLLKEYAEEKRLFVTIDNIPDLVKQAFISAEDKNFYRNSGLDIESLFSATIYSIYAYFNGLQLRGGSTITQQVVKNMLLTNERTIQRKIKEAILSLRITRDFSKDKILELYLNHIFLGNNAYGVAAAALVYFDKPLDELSLEEAALIAALPKAPGKMNPVKNYERALARRNWVLERMEKDGYINKKQYNEAIKTDIVLRKKQEKDEYFNYGAFVEEVRKNMLNKFSEESLMREGFVITSTIDPKVQKALDKALKDGLESYDKRHGYRGALGNIFDGDADSFQINWPIKLKDFNINEYYRNNWKRAVVLDFDNENQKIIIGLLYNENSELYNFEEIVDINDTKAKKSYLALANIKWAIDSTLIDHIEIDSNGYEIKKTYRVENIKGVNLKVGDIIFVENSKKNGYLLRQTPIVNGAAVALDVHSGRVLGMVGGYIDSEINFNRATQAKRQPGSAIKPFVYLTALENGYRPSDMIMDEEIVLPQGQDAPMYRPRNYDNKYHGLVTLRKALQSSYNVSTVRLSSQIGLRKVAETIKKFGINNRPKRVYSVALGSLETHLIDMVKAYAMLINGGKYIEMETIEKVQDKYGKTVFRRDPRKCDNCIVDIKNISEIEIPFLKDDRETIADPASAYQITYMLEGAVKYGTAWRARIIGKPLGAKTGTSNDFRDAWFIGFSPDFVVGVYIGFDDNRTLGEGETGSKAAAPTFTEAMKEILENQPAIPFRIPDNITFRKIDISTGKEPTLVSNKNSIILEAFKTSDEKNNEKIKRDENEDILKEFGIDVDYVQEEYYENKKDNSENIIDNDKNYYDDSDAKEDNFKNDIINMNF